MPRIRLHAVRARRSGKGGLLYVNQVAMVGNLTGDPRVGDGEAKVVNFRMAVSRPRRPGEELPEGKERTEFVDVECWGSQADNIGSSLRGGDRAIVVGQLKYDRWTDVDGNPRSRLSVRAAAVGQSLEFQRSMSMKQE